MAPRKHSLRLPAARGFVLPVTVILLALISVGVSLMAHRSDQLRSLVGASRQEQRASVAVQNALAQALYLTSTLYRRGARLGDIELDGRYYRTGDGTFVRFQDAAGLLNLRRASRNELLGLLRALGVPDAKADGLADTLLDYADADDLVRLNGAETADYNAAGMPPPRNAQLLMPTELQRIIGWRDLDAETVRKILENVSVHTINAVSRYSVKAPVLAAVSGADIDLARALLAQRAPETPLALESLPNVARGSFLSASRYITLPSTTTLLTVCPPSVAWCQHISLTATADDGPAPWHVDYSVRQMRPAPLPPLQQVAALPDQPPTQPPAPFITPFGNLQ
jgi:type II secretory pathway component PulK